MQPKKNELYLGFWKFQASGPVKMGIFYQPVLRECFTLRFAGFASPKVHDKRSLEENQGGLRTFDQNPISNAVATPHGASPLTTVKSPPQKVIQEGVM